MRIMKTLKRMMALFLATVLVCTAIRTTSGAGDLINLNPYRQVFRGKNLNAFGRTHRDMNIYQVGEGAGALPALCIQEGHKLPDGSPAKYEQYYVEPGKPVPVIGPFERYLSMVLAYEWLVSDNYYVPARYGVVQVYYWGCMNGYEHNWALQKQAMEKFQAVMNGDPMVMVYYEEMKAHILEGEAQFNGTGSSSLPAWTGSVQKMTLKDGHYELTLDISSCPQLQDTSWSFPDNQWSYKLAPDGRSVTFQYNGNQEPQGTIMSAQIQGIENRFYAYIFTPAASENLQKQLGWLDFNRPMASVSFSVGTDAVLPGSSDLELCRHSETFQSNYNIDLEKYCAETNQPLEGTVFNVWEDFDFSQVNEQGYEEGEPDGTSGQVYLNCMSPEPENDYVCDILTTDPDGYARHSDTRYYNYSKTYCMGHPAPEWTECDHEEDEDCSCDEENDRLRGQWRAEQELCAATCDFHALNNDEDNREQDTSAMEAMLADRDETYERFIELEYSYHLQEKTARTGYILHGLHNDDKEIETVVLSAAQAGGSARPAVYRPGSFVGKAVEPVYTYVAAMRERRAYKYPVPDALEMELGEQRSIFSLWGDEKEKKKPEIPADGAAAGGIFGDQENTSGSAGDQEAGDGTQGEEEDTSGDGGQDEDGNGNPEGEEEKDGEMTEKNPENGNKEDVESGGTETGNSASGGAGPETGNSEGGETETENSGSGGAGPETGNSGSGGARPESTGNGGAGPETGNSGSEGAGPESTGNEGAGSETGNSGSEGAGPENTGSGGPKSDGSISEKTGDSRQKNETSYREDQDSGSQKKEEQKSGNLQVQSYSMSASPILLKSSHGKTILFSGISSEEHTVNSKHQSQNKPEDTANENIKYETDEDTKKEMNEEINKDTNGKADADTEINIEISSENSTDNTADNTTDKEKHEIQDSTTETADIRDEAEGNSHIENQDGTSQRDGDEEDGGQSQIYEEYEYARNPISPSFGMAAYFQADTGNGDEEPEEEGNRAVRFIRSLFSGEEDDDDTISVSLPSFMDDDLGALDVSAYGEPDTILYTFKVWDHRTEGRLHINKRDLELYRADGDKSYGLTQGDATLEGAVYGLFAAQDIIHPDGKSGTIYNQNDLTAVAATDKQGNASFLAYTEKPGTRLSDDGTIIAPENATGPENLYNGSSVTSSAQGFGTVVYPDYVLSNEDQWIGRPLIMGSYYVMELSRSEGYELSVNGISLKESNRTQDIVNRIHEAGQARISGGLSDYNSMDADGSWNDFIVESYKTENGYDIILTGYPQGAEFYEIRTGTETKTYKAVLGSSLQPKVDQQGRPVYQTAKGGEYKIGADGNPIIRLDTATDSDTGERTPYGETLPYRFRTAPYPSGTAVPADMSKWGQAIEPHYLSKQVNGMLGQLGYRPVTDISPWTQIRLSGQTNAQAAEEIMDWYTVHNFFDCGYVEDIYEIEGSFFALLRHDYSLGHAGFPAVYDFVNRKLYVRKTAEVSGGPAGKVGYWIEYQKGEYSLKSAVASIKEKREINQVIPFGSDIEAAAETVYQPLYETYSEGDIVLDREGNPIPLMERVYEYEDRTETYETDKPEPVSAVYDWATGNYAVHVENTIDWKDRTEPEYTEFRVVTREKTIDWEGEELPYSQYLTDIAGAGVSALAAVPLLDEGSYVVFQALNYPGQNQPVQEAGTGSSPLQVLQRVIKQSVKVTKDISQSSYDGVNTYGSVHNDPLTVLLGLFNGGSSSQGAKLLNQFKFKAYLKSNLENIFVDSAGNIISEDIGTADFKGDVQKIFLPPRDGSGQRLLETKEDGSYDYTKFFDAMYAAVQVEKGKKPQEAIQQFAVDYYDIDAYKAEILTAEPGLNSDTAYEKALLRAADEAGSYLSVFSGLDNRLAIAWDSDAGGGADGDVTTLQCNTRNGKDDYFNHSIMLAYGTYVIVEQVPADVDRELANRHFTRDYPREITLPFVPDIGQDEGTGETDVNYQTGSPYFRYDSTDTPDDLIRKYKIRFNEETHIIQANGQDGKFEIYKYGLDKDMRPGRSLTSHAPYEEEYMDGRNDTVKGYYAGYTSQSEDAGIMEGVIYDGYETEDGQWEVRDQVATMKGMQTAVDGKFASMLVPWTVLPPAVDRINPDTGNVETLIPSGNGRDFNFVAFAQEDFEDEYFNSRLRIEKLDSETGDSIIHDGALFKIYAAKREVEKEGMGTVTGSGNVLYGEAVDWQGNPVADADGRRILYPRVGKNNGSTDDLPVRLDKDGIPQYDESQLIRQEDQEGNETGVFRAYSTIRELVVDGQVKKVPVGYIETYKPLGAGVYVLVEIQAPKGYGKSRPVAFEVYADNVSFYRERRNADGTTDGWEEETAVRYQYAIPVAGSTNKVRTSTVSRIKVEDYPSRMEIHKVEDGDSLVGNQNILQKTDDQGRVESSGGFETDVTVNDAGDLLVYKVSGRKEKLEERGDVRDIAYNPKTMQWDGYVTKSFDEYSEHIVEGTEKELKAMSGVKPLYRLDGTFTGRGIRFDISVSGAVLSLYHAMEIEKIGEHVYKGVSASVKDGKVTGITDTNTGTHKEIRVVGEENSPGGAVKTHTASWDVWDAVIVDNDPVNLYFHDLTQVDTREDPDTGELLVLDKKGNPLCFADSVTGMAYVYDDYGRMLAYTADDEGNKILVKSIQVLKDENGQTIYDNKTTVDDENGLPIYYTSGNVVTKDESWTTDSSMDSNGTQETSGARHLIARLPFGSYILEEQGVPYDQGYIQARYMGLVLQDTDQVQKYFLQNEFTKTAFAKLDVRTQKEIRGAVMTLYRAGLDSDGSPHREQDGTYKKGQVYASWISGYQYDDDGNIKLDEHGEPATTTKPHWIDHIPVGYYVLEETICPYEQGYVQSEAVNIDVLETGDVQSFEMEDDFTSIDILKYDTKNGDVIYGDSEAYLTLYRPILDEKGFPVLEHGIPRYDETGRIFTFRAATYKDGQDVAATGRVVPDAGGNHPIMKYDYDFREIPGTYQGRYYYTEQGTVRLEYLPAGNYVLAETENPEGYATADPILINIEETGHLEEIQYFQMGDKPLKLEVSKVDITGGKEVNGAKLAVYPVDEKGNVSEIPLVLHQPSEDGQYQDIEAVWISGLDGRYTEEDGEQGLIPAGFQPGDLKPHTLEYIPEGDYILREIITPYGFLQSVDIPFTIADSQVLQKTEMTDEIPDGILRIIKSDSDKPDEKLMGAEFCLVNQTTGAICGTVTTDQLGQAQFEPQPIGYMDRDGNFKPYTYVCSEIKAAPGHMLTLEPYEFQFHYRNELTDLIVWEYNPTNDSNRVITDKLSGDTEEMLEGALLRIERRTESGWETAEEWVSGRQGHYTKNLSEGQYRLIEVKAPEGYKLQETPIEFTISDGMTGIPHLVMRNYTTIIDVEKTSAETGKLLGGARLQLIDKSDGRVIREWTSEAGRGQQFYGLKPGTYIIHELQAPSGYERTEDREIVVKEWSGTEGPEMDQKAGNELHNMVQVFRFENQTASSSGGGGGNRPRPKAEYITFKKTDVSGKVLQGAEFTFYDQTGRVIGTSVSDSTGTFRIRRPDNGTYTFRETKAPGGYALNPGIFSFTVNGSDVIRGAYEVVDKELEFTVTKLDGDSGLPLMGARFRIGKGENRVWDQEPENTGKGINGSAAGTITEAVTGADGTFTCRLTTPGLYVIRETEAPLGYERSDKVYEFTMDAEGRIQGEAVMQGSVTIYNWKEKPPVRKIGSITAVYQVGSRFGKGTYHFGSGPRDTVRTGDDLPVAAAAAMAVLCMAGFSMCLCMKQKREWSKGRKWVIFILVLIPVTVYLAFDVLAEETDSISVSGKIVYSSMENIEPVPQTAWVLARDEISGKERNVLLPLVSYHFSDKHWEDGFRLDLKVRDYDAGFYEVGGVRIETQKEEIRESLMDYEAEILGQAGLDSEAYRIDQFQWNGGVYESDGVLCRNLTAIGRKMVADCTAVYGGEVSRNVFLNDSKGDEESGQIGDSGIDERYVIKNNVQPFFSMGVTVPAAGICFVALIAAMVLAMIKNTRPYGMAAVMFMFFAGVGSACIFW
ncbi:SrtB family sortase [Enterocloster bolteae 90B7]|nr:SpaA isopeptide-forming pilin-related protein [Enterocloster bolteae]ENZ63605.1 SrtB family sortase [Enterocloster bolteae 90B7]